jgi:PleD family two-component response regulator
MTDAGRILIVEDEPALRELVAVALEREGFRVRQAADGQEGLRLARAEGADVILLDVMLPKLNGFEVCQRLRQDPSTALIPVVMLTALGELKDRLTGFKLGADEYLCKPFDVAELVARVERLRRRARDEVGANPLTGLPGAVALEREIKRRLDDKKEFSLALADLRGMKGINRVFGYERGDSFLRATGLVLRSAVTELGNAEELVAHLGGDDFAFLTEPARAEVMATRAMESADQLFPLYYDEEDRRRGRLTRPAAGDGVAVDEPFLSLRFALVDVPSGSANHPVPILEAARALLARPDNARGLQRETFGAARG